MDKFIIFVTGILCYVIVVGFIVSLIWGWVIPSIFPRLVEEGYIAGNLNVFQAFGVAALCVLLFNTKMSLK